MIELIQKKKEKGNLNFATKSVKPAPIKNNDRQYGSELDDDGECLHKSITLHTKQILRDNHVAGARHWQKLGKPFYNGYDNSLNSCHYKCDILTV